MVKLIWSPTALDDIDSIAAYISRDSISRAKHFVNKLIHAAEVVVEHPEIGRVIPEINNHACREIIYRAYRIMYRIEDDEIWITGVVHGARDWKPE